jgi:hypothetical protein
MPEPKESISLYRQGYAYLGTHEGGHIDKEYDILKDETSPEGVRTIVLRERDLTAFKEKAARITDLLLEKIGESDSKAMRGLLCDILGDFTEKHLDEIEWKLGRGAPVKIREGCYKILIGDGRRKNSVEIMLRE